MTYIYNNKIKNISSGVNLSATEQTVSTTLLYLKNTGITYTPPAGANKVIYMLDSQISWSPDNQGSLLSSRLQYSTDSTNYEDGTWTTISGTQLNEGNNSTDSDYVRHTFFWTFILSAWSGERKLRVAGRAYDSNVEMTWMAAHNESPPNTGAATAGSTPNILIYSI